MSDSSLLFIRFFAPAVILVVLGYAVGKLIGLSAADVPVSVNDLGYNLSYIVVAAIYQYLPLRRFAYAPFRADVDEKLRLCMVAISELADDPVKLSWDRVCNVFYWLIDNDNSLGKRAGDVRFNGAMMTSFADLTAISGLYAIGTLIAYFAGLPSLLAFALLVGLLLVSVLMQYLSMRRHETLGEYQLGYIEQVKKAEVVAKLTELNA